jgi:hypothetical protein
MLDSDDSTSYTSLNQIRKDSNSYGSSNEAAAGSPKKQQQRFTSNMCAILNDPRKDRNKINYLFTKTWGSDFIDTSPIPSIKTLHSNYSNLKKIEFNDYIKYISEVCFFVCLCISRRYNYINFKSNRNIQDILKTKLCRVIQN